MGVLNLSVYLILLQGDYVYDDKDLNGNIRNGVIEKVSNVLDFDYYEDGSDYGMAASSNSATGI